MTSPTSAGSSASPVPSRTRLHWSVAAPLSAAAGVGAAVVGFLTDVPVLGLAGAVVAAVPAILAARRVPALHADLDRCRAEQAAAPVALAPAVEIAAVPTTTIEPAETTPVRPFVTAAAPAPQTVDLAAAEAAPAPRVVVDLVKAPVPAEPAVPAQQPKQDPAKHLVRHAAVAAGRVSTAGSPSTTDQDAPAAERKFDPRVDTAELQKIWDLGEAAARTRSGRGRRVRVGAEVDALPDRPRNIAGHRRRARHRA